MQTEYRVLFPQGEILFGEVDWPVIPGAELIGPLVRPYLHGEQFQLVPIWFGDRLVEMAVCEMGHVRLKTRAPLPVNVTATGLYRASYKRLYPEDDAEGMPQIAGAAVLFNRELGS